MSLAPAPLGAEARLFLRDEELDSALELFVLAEAALAMAAEGALENEPARLGRGHWRAAFLLKRRPGLGVQELARLTGLSKQGARRAPGPTTRAVVPPPSPSRAPPSRSASPNACATS